MGIGEIKFDFLIKNLNTLKFYQIKNDNYYNI